MTKEMVQDSAKEIEAQEPRKLNMEEKRKLEKLLLANIDSAVARRNAQTAEMRGTLIEKLLKNPPAEVKKLFESYALARKQQDQIESKLKALGYDIAYDDTLRVKTCGRLSTELATFEDLAKKTRESLHALKRNYVIKLFADHADTQSLFATLAKDLERLIG